MGCKKHKKVIGHYGKKEVVLHDYVKRLGQHHLAEHGDCTTLCGMPMLGNNYARLLPRSEWEKCPVCHEKAKKMRQ